MKIFKKPYRNQIKEAFHTLTTYKSNFSPDGREYTMHLFVDPFDQNNLETTSKLVQGENHIIIGRRGTGKSLFLSRAYCECLLSIDGKSNIIKDKKVLGVYINLQEQWYGAQAMDEKIIWINFLQHIIESIYHELKENYQNRGILSRFRRRQNKILQKLKVLKDKAKAGEYITGPSGEMTIRDKKERAKRLGAKASLQELSVVAERGLKEEEERILATIAKRSELFPEVVQGLDQIRRETDIDYICLFLDEYSEIPRHIQKIIANDLFPLIITGDSQIHAKIAVYPEGYELGKLSIMREFSPIYLDYINMYEHVVAGIPESNIKKRYEKSLEATTQFTKRLIKRRLDFFSDGKISFENIFRVEGKDDEKEILETLFLISMNVPRNIGFLLGLSWDAAIQQKRQIDRNMLYSLAPNFYDRCRSDLVSVISKIYGIEEREIIYNWGEIISRSRFLKKMPKSRKNQPSSHFMVDPTLREYLSPLEGAFLIFNVAKQKPVDITRISDSAESVRFDVFALNMGICQRENIIYEFNPQIFSKNQFDYSDLFSDVEKMSCPIHGVLRVNEIRKIKEKEGFYCDKCIGDGEFIKVKISKRIRKFDKSGEREVKVILEQMDLPHWLFEKGVLVETDFLPSEVVFVLNESKNTLKDKDIAQMISNKVGSDVNYQLVTWAIKRINRRCKENSIPDLILRDNNRQKSLNAEIVNLSKKNKSIYA